MRALLMLVAATVGTLNTIQAGANAQLGKVLDRPFAAALVIVAVSGTFITATGLVTGQLSWPGQERFGQVPWWGWLGGLFGACYVLATLCVASSLGAAVFMGLTVTAAVVTSVALDHFGWVGFEVHPAGLWRLVGCALMIGGVALIARF